MKKKLVKFSKEYNILSLKKGLTKTINYYNKYN